MAPIHAQCTRCRGDFPLYAVVEEGTGLCPHCFGPLANGETGALLEWAAVADAAQYRLSAAMRFLQQTDGHLFVDWEAVVRSLAAETESRDERPRSRERHLQVVERRSCI